MKIFFIKINGNNYKSKDYNTNTLKVIVLGNQNISKYKGTGRILRKNIKIIQSIVQSRFLF
jgi:hypothetical protein